jgi:hypothetical protein
VRRVLEGSGAEAGNFECLLGACDACLEETREVAAGICGGSKAAATPTREETGTVGDGALRCPSLSAVSTLGIVSTSTLPCNLILPLFFLTL